MVINEEKEAKYIADFAKFIEVVKSYVERKQKAYLSKETPSSFFTETDRKLIDECSADISKILAVVDGHVNNELNPDDLAPKAFENTINVATNLIACDKLDRTEKEVLRQVVTDLHEIENNNPRPAHRQ